MRRAVIPLALITAGSAGAEDWPDCYCTGTHGERVELGERACLVVDGRAFLAQCEMALNVPIWRSTEEACVSAGVERGPGGLGPTLQSVPVDPEILAPEAES